MLPIDLKSLYLEIGKNKYPVLAADTVFSINALPTVRVTISAAENVDGKNKVAFPSEREKGQIANLTLEFTAGDNTVRKVVLFCGYILTEAPALSVSITSVRGTVTYQLVCDAGKISGVPYGSLGYYGLVADKLVDVNARAYDTLATPLKDAASARWGELSKQFKTAPAVALVKMLDVFRSGFSKGPNTFPLLQNTLISASGPLSVSLPNTNLVVSELASKVQPALRNNPVLGVYLALLRQVYLGFIPQPVCARNVPCKLIIKPFNAWSNERLYDDVYLTASDILGVNEQTLYNLDQRIDYWVVRLVGDGDRIAVYGPNTGGNRGRARCLSEKEFQTQLGNIYKANRNQTAFAAARIIGLPGWLALANLRWRPVEVKKKLGTTTVTTAKYDQAYVEDVAKKLAITGYLTEGCSAVNIGVTVAPEVYLSNLYLLGRMMILQLPQMTAEGVANRTRDYYGLLDSMGMHISVERKALQVTCSMHFSNVHTAAMHQEFKSATPFYTAVDHEAGLGPAFELNGYFIGD